MHCLRVTSGRGDMGRPPIAADMGRPPHIGGRRLRDPAPARRRRPSPLRRTPQEAVLYVGYSGNRKAARVVPPSAVLTDPAFPFKRRSSAAAWCSACQQVATRRDHAGHALSNKLKGRGKTEASRFGWLSIGSKASRAIKTENGISILPAVEGSDVKASEAIRKSIAQARSSGDYDLVILDGPAMPWSAADRKLLEPADGLVAMLPVDLDINDAMDGIITALGGAERKLIGVVLNERTPPGSSQQRDKRYA